MALKVVKSASHYTDAARDEITILKRSTVADPNNEHCILLLLDHFDFLGPNGNRKSSVFLSDTQMLSWCSRDLVATSCPPYGCTGIADSLFLSLE